MIREITIVVTTTGGAGVATGTGLSDTKLNGFLEDVQVDYHASAPATTDVVLSLVTPTRGNVLTLTDTNTDARFIPRDTCVSPANAAITNSNTRIPLNGYLQVAVAQSNALTAAVTVTVRYADAASVVLGVKKPTRKRNPIKA